MSFRRRARIEDLARSGDAASRALALVELGRLDEAGHALAETSPRERGSAVARARHAHAQGDFLRALRLLEPAVPDAAPDRASVLASLGRADEALELVGGEEPSHRLARAELHLLVGEPGPASVALAAWDGTETAPASAPDEADVDRWTRPARIASARGELAIALHRPGEAIAALREARDRAEELGAVTLVARAAAALGEAHAIAGNRWRALRSVTRAMDVAGSHGVAAWARAGIHYRAYLVYGRYGHAALAESAMQSGHHLVLQLASGIEERAYREAFLIDNPDNQKIVGAWKGESSWGLDISRSSS